MHIISTLTVSAAILSCMASAFALPQDIKTIPEPNTTMEALSEFSIKSGWLELKNSGNSGSIVINGSPTKVTLSSVSYEEIKFTLESSWSKAGNCNIIIPEDMFLMGWEGDPNPIIEFSYIIENDNGDDPGEDPSDEIMNTVPQGYTFIPAAGTEIETLSEFSVDAADDMFLTPASRTTKITINGEAIHTITTVTGTLHNCLTWHLDNPITEPGNYTIYIPKGEFWGFDEQDNEPFLVTVIVTGGEAPEPVYYPGVMQTVPESGSSIPVLDKIAVQSEKLSSLYKGPECDKITVSFNGEPIDAEFTLTPDEDTFNEAHVIWMEFATPLVEAGDYTLNFPAKAFEVGKYPDAWYTAPFSSTLTVKPDSGIDEVTEESLNDYEIYNLQGVKITNPAPGSIVILRNGDKTLKVRL